jgi:hypothetical protein
MAENLINKVLTRESDRPISDQVFFLEKLAQREEEATWQVEKMEIQKRRETQRLQQAAQQQQQQLYFNNGGEELLLSGSVNMVNPIEDFGQQSYDGTQPEEFYDDFLNFNEF